MPTPMTSQKKIEVPKGLELIGEQLRVLDQTQLPLRLIYHDFFDYKQVISAIKRLVVRGAPAIGIAAAYGVAMAVKQTGRYSQDQVEEFAQEFRQSRPTAVNLFWAMDRMVGAYIAEGPQNYQQALDILWTEARAIHDEDRAMCAAIGRFGNDLLPKDAVILTHCNTGALATGGIGTAIGVLYTMAEAGKNPRVFVDETRPVLQGARLTMWELLHAGIDATLICDNAAAMVMKTRGVQAVIVGADRIANNGDTANKIGTYGLAVIAQSLGIPFYVAAPESTFDRKMDSGAEIVIEERDPREVTHTFGQSTAPENSPVYSPAFDITPGELVSAFITDTGVKPGRRTS